MALGPSYAMEAGVAGMSTIEMARWACGLLAADNAPEPASSASLPRQMATITLFLEHQCGASREEALAVAVREVASWRALTPGSIKKNRSEVRALLAFGWDGGPPSATPPSAQPADLLHDLAARISAIRLADIRKLRVDTLQGARGGRPASNEMRILALVRRLRAAAADDAVSAAEFEAIRLELAD